MGGLEEKKKMGPELGSIWRRELGVFTRGNWEKRKVEIYSNISELNENKKKIKMRSDF